MNQNRAKSNPQAEASRPQSEWTSSLVLSCTQTSLHKSSEPILIPKLRIQFADFPYLRCPVGQRLSTLETRCGHWYDLDRRLLVHPRIFMGQPRPPRHPERPGCYS